MQNMTMTKAELADLLFEKVGLNKREAKDMVEAFFEEVRTALEAGDSVKLSGFGNFQLRDKPQRPGRNPKTGEEIPITARRVVTFYQASQRPCHHWPHLLLNRHPCRCLQLLRLGAWRAG